MGSHRYLWSREQNIFYHRADHGLKQHGAKELHAKDTVPLGAAISTLSRIHAAIHVYGGDFFVTPRSEWNPETFEERPYDVEDTMRAFDKANDRLGSKAPRS